MLRRQVVEAADAANAARIPAHGAIAARRADHLDARAVLAVRLFAHAAGRVARNAEHIDALFLVRLGQRRSILAVGGPEPARRIEHRLRGRAGALVAEPEVGHQHLQVDPGLRILVVEHITAVGLALEGVDEAALGQQLQGAAEAGDEVEHFLHAVREVEPHQRAQGVALADDVLDHRVRALVRRAQHHQARAFARHQRIHHRTALVDAGAHHQPAHAVRQQPDRRIAFLHQPIEELAQAFGQHVERLAPVVRETFDAVAAREVLADLAVEHREQFVGLDAGLAPGDLREAAAGDVERIEPDAVTAVSLQVRAHHAGQHDDDRPLRVADVATARRVRQRRRVLGRARQCAEGVEHGRVVADEPVAQRSARVDVGEVAEVRDIGAAVEQHARAGPRRDACEHRRRVDDEVVVLLVEQQEVGEQDTEPLQQVAALDVAGDHRHRDAGLYRRIAQQPRHRRVGQHCLDAGHEVRVGAVLRDLDHDALEG